MKIEGEESEKGRVGRAVELWLSYLEQPDPEPLDRFLTNQEADLRDVLTLLAQGEPTSWIRELEHCALQIEISPEGGAALEEYLAKLKRFERREMPYSTVAEIAQGGMGKVTLVRDESLRRHVAMKVIRELEGSCDGAGADPVTLGRFLDEAQVTGQLDHPGIVPVHELGIDSAGRAFFTMRLVKGKTLDGIFKLARCAAEGWTQTRVLEIFLKVCDTLAYAHSKGVIHRDLKPSNVMVGRFGEVYVMDWGLAKILGREDPRDLRIRPPVSTVQSRVRTDRSEEAESDPDSPLVTMDGAVIGTPCYMSPEQAEGRVQDLGRRSEVYAVGAMLYTFLGGQRPYLKSDSPISPYAILAAVAEGPPAPLRVLDPAVTPELAAICEKAMARDTEERYESMTALAADLRAYLDRRVVGAHRTGALAELRKWVHRNRSLATAILLVILALAVGCAVSLRFYSQAQEAAEEVRSQLRSTQDAHAVTLSSAIDKLRRRAAADLWPANSSAVQQMKEWLSEAFALTEQLETYRASLAVLEAEEPEPGAGAASSIGSPAWRRDRLRELIPKMEALHSEEELLPDGPAGMYGTTIEHIQRRLAIATGLRERTISSAAAAELWREARADIADPRGPYGGFDLRPQEGLVPLSKNPRTNLWEFWCPLSGETPELDPEWTWNGGDAPAGKVLAHPNRWLLRGETALVFVLIPADTFYLGASRKEGDPNYCPDAGDEEGPPQRVNLAAFFISKYEMNQGQWIRLAGKNPSFYPAGARSPVLAITHTLVHPVESVSRDDALYYLQRLGMVLPTEAQWERAARAGTTTPWSSGAGEDSLRGCANLADRSALLEKQNWGWLGFDDGWPAHSPVGHFRPNGYGLHDVHGNVQEWCLDNYGDYENHPWRSGDGLRLLPFKSSYGVLRGGDYKSYPVEARSSRRSDWRRENRDSTTGLRPTIALVQP